MPTARQDAQTGLKDTDIDSDTTVLRNFLRERIGGYSELQSELTRLRQVVVELNTDLAEQKAGVRHAQYLARHDFLTGLPNRAYLRECMEEKLSLAREQRKAMAVIYLDIDSFKSINDTFGHTVGDAVLCIVSARLCRALRAEDIVARFGGDEFVCLLTGFTSRGQISHTVQKVIDAVAATERGERYGYQCAGEYWDCFVSRRRRQRREPADAGGQRHVLLEKAGSGSRIL